jgi:peptidoglycan hydrolase CwlO-like protein
MSSSHGKSSVPSHGGSGQPGSGGPGSLSQSSREVFSDLETMINTLQAEKESLEDEVLALHGKNQTLTEENQALKKEVRALQEKDNKVQREPRNDAADEAPGKDLGAQSTGELPSK